MNWSNNTLDDVATVTNGKTPSRAEKRDAGHPVLKIRDVDDVGRFRGTGESYVEASMAAKFRSKWTAPGDTLILNAAHNADYVGSKAFYVSEDAKDLLATGEWLMVRPDPTKLDRKYAHYWLTSASVKAQIKKAVKGIHLYPKDIARMRILLPPLPEQQRIAAILDKADALCCLRRQSLERLAALGQSIFRDMFGDLVANDREFPPGAVADLVLSFDTGKNLAPAPSNEITRNRVLKVSAVTSGTFNSAESKPLPDSYYPPVSHFVNSGDLLFSRANTEFLIGATAFVEQVADNIVLPDKIWRFRWRQDNEAIFVHHLFQSKPMRREISRRASGTSGSMKNIGKEKVLSIAIGIPGANSRREFERRVAGANSLLMKAIAASRATTALFNSLQHRAFTGEL